MHVLLSDPTVPMNFERMTDEQLAAAARDGNHVCFDHLYKRRRRDTRAFIGTIVWHREDADDVTQEVWLRAWRRIDRFDPSRRFMSWISRIAFNASMSFLRHRATRPEPADVDPDTTRSGNPTADREVLEADRLTRALAELDPRERAAVMLREWGYSVPEVAEILGIEDSKKHSKTNGLLNRAREKLRKLLDEGDGEGGLTR